MEEVALEVPRMSSSEEVALKNCRLAHHFEYDLGYRPRVTAWNLSTGIGYHEGVEVLYVTGSVDAALARVDEWAEERWQEYVDMGMSQDGGVVVSYVQQVALVKAMVENYAKWVKEEGIDDDWDVVSVEEKLYVELEGAATVLPMKLDLLQRNKRSGRLRIVDHKTRDKFGHDLTGYQLSEQNGNYTLGIYAAYGEWPTALAYREARKMAPQTNPKSSPPYFREVEVVLTQAEALERAKEYVIVSNERMNPDRAIYANPGSCCGSWKADWRSPCLKVHQGMTPLEALEASDQYAPADVYARYAKEADTE